MDVELPPPVIAPALQNVKGSTIQLYSKVNSNQSDKKHLITVNVYEGG